jgi:fatty acid desaturase
MTILLGWQLGLVAGLSAWIGVWAYPVLWLVPLYLFTYLADVARSFLEHAHAEPDEQADCHRLISYRANALETALFAPMAMNFHAAHHLWPSIPYYNLATADAELRAFEDTGDLIWRRSYVGQLARYLSALPFDCEPARHA